MGSGATSDAPVLTDDRPSSTSGDPSLDVYWGWSPSRRSIKRGAWEIGLTGSARQARAGRVEVGGVAVLGDPVEVISAAMVSPARDSMPR